MRRMSRFTFTRGALVLAFAAATLAPNVAFELRAEVSEIDSAAAKALERMTVYVSSLKEFSVNTQTTIEDLLDEHRVDLDISAKVIVKRPNKLLAERMGDRIDQIFYYDGTTLTLYNPADKVYATEPAPGNIEELLNFARAKLGLIIPAADLIYRNAYPLLMQDVTFAVVVDKAYINGVKCDHLLFSRPGVDFQVWVAENGNPLPYKYVVTDTTTPARISISTVMSDWNVDPKATDGQFEFTPPDGVKKIGFMPLETSGGSEPAGETK